MLRTKSSANRYKRMGPNPIWPTSRCRIYTSNLKLHRRDNWVIKVNCNPNRGSNH